jgi:hypothetical protein
MMDELARAVIALGKTLGLETQTAPEELSATGHFKSLQTSVRWRNPHNGCWCQYKRRRATTERRRDWRALSRMIAARCCAP